MEEMDGKPFCLGIVLYFFLVQCMVMQHQLHTPGEQYYSDSDLAAVYEEVCDMNPDEQIRSLHEEAAEYRERLFYHSDQTQAIRGYGQLMARKHVADHIEECLRYPDYLESVSQQADFVSGSLLLVQANSFSSRNNQAIAERYASLEAVSIRADSSAGIEALTQLSMADLVLLIFISISTCVFTVSEKNEGYFLMLRTKTKGDIPLYMAKLIMLCLCTLGLACVVNGGNFLFIKWTIGFCYMHLP